MNVLIVASAITRAAGIVPTALAEIMQAHGHQCAILTLHDQEQTPQVVSLLKSSPYTFVNRLKRWARFALAGYFRRPPIANKYRYRDFFAMIPMASNRRLKKSLPFAPDQIIVTFNENLLTFKQLAWLSRTYGAVVHFYCMDVAHFSGGCHFLYECEGYQSSCNNCPAVPKRYARIPSQIMKYKARAIMQMNATAIAISSPYLNRLHHSRLFAHGSNGIIYHAIKDVTLNKSASLAAHTRFSIPTEALCLMVCALKLDMEFKGAHLVLAALNKCAHRLAQKQPLHLLVVGHASGWQEMVGNLPVQVHETGFLEREDMSDAYFATDLFLSGSWEEPGPLTVEEAMMHGVPVVAFNIGVAVDMIEQGVSGFIVQNSGDTQTFAHYIEEYAAYSDEQRQQMIAAAHASVKQKCSYEKHYQSFLNLFQLNITSGSHQDPGGLCRSVRDKK
jgi:glycosyltransferase involved in cell wall biosynthesis